jgi:hypothetical protein
MPSVDVISGTIMPTGEEIELNESFEWTCTSAPQGTEITVIAALMPNGQPWFSPSPTPSFEATSGSVTVTANGAGEWSWQATGVKVQSGARVKVITTMGVEQKKAS